MIARIQTFARRYLLADTIALSPAERWRSAWGALLSMGLCGLLMHAMPVDSHWLIAPIGASTVILFALSHSPLAQPWSVMGGYLVATLAALVCTLLIPWPQLAAAVAVAASIWMMARFNCFHPPSGALALFLVLDGPYPPERLAPTMLLVFVNMAVMLLAAFLVNNYVLRRRYPYTPETAADNLHRTADAAPLARIGLTHADLEQAVRQLNTFVDIQEGELVRLYNLAVDHAFNRHVGLSCGDIMSRDITTVEFATELDEAWRLLRAHKIKALPVVERNGRLIGMVTVADYLRQLDDTTAAGLAIRLQGLLRRTPGPTSEKAEVVGQIMSKQLETARIDTPISELVYALSDKGMHHFPVLDDKHRVVGMVTQSDLIAALYKRIALQCDMPTLSTAPPPDSHSVSPSPITPRVVRD
jgi:CBS domain-containing membrane protein